MFGLFGMVFVVLRRLGRNATGIVTVLVLNAVLAIVLPQISWQAHVGGLASPASCWGWPTPTCRARCGTVTAVAAPAVLTVLLVALAAAKLGSAG